MNKYNRIIRMVTDSNIVYIDGKTIKDIFNEPDISFSDAEDLLKDVDDKYVIEYFNRDYKYGQRVLRLKSI